MDIEEIKKYSKNKIEADDLIKQVRQRIKETIWDKQNKREGFTETFKPLISQFEKPEDSKAQNIFTQNQEMLKNQLALTSGISDNQKAITDGFSQFKRLIDAQDKLSQLDRLADMQELPGVEAIEDDEKDEAQAPIVKLDLEKNFNDKDLSILTKSNYTRPNDFYDITIQDLEKDLEDVKSDIKKLTGQINGRNEHKETLMKYKNTMLDYFKSLDYKVGEGLYSSRQELLYRFELLNGSLAAGNNGVLPEYIQIAHRLRDLRIITNNQLNTLLRKVI